jgi:hypothetical protein
VSSLIQHLLAPLKTDEFELGVYFGHDTGDLYHPLSRELFALFQVPLLSARFQQTEAELMAMAGELLAKSALMIAQEWLPTKFDWRVGILDRRVLFVAKYFSPPAIGRF